MGELSWQRIILAITIDSVPRSLIVVGGGPAGLSAALSARQHGAGTVTVLEQRSLPYSRHRMVGLAPTIAKDLEWLGLPIERTSTRLKSLHVGISKDPIDIPIPPQVFAWPHSPAPHLTSADLFQHPPVRSALINELEEGLRTSALRSGIEVLTNVKVVGLDGPNVSGKSKVTYETESRTGEMEADFVVVADGSKSPLGAMLGVRRFVASDHETLVWGVSDESTEDFGLIFGTGFDPQRMLRIGTRKGTGFGLSVAPDIADKIKSDEQARLAYAAEYLPLLKLRVEDIAILTAFDHQSTWIDRTILRGGKVFIIGDAARSVCPWTGAGLNMGVRDGVVVGELLAKLGESGSLQAREDLLRRHEVHMMGARQLLQASELLFGMRLQNNALARGAQTLAYAAHLGPIGAPIASTALRAGFISYYFLARAAGLVTSGSIDPV